MRNLRSRRRTPLCGTRLSHYLLVDARAETDYLLRAWPDPRFYRRLWSTNEWFETAPPRMDIEAWTREEVPWLRRALPHRRRRTRRSRGQTSFAFVDEVPRVHTEGIRGFVDSIPGDVRETISAFRLGQFPLLQLLAEHPPARDVISDSPVLVMALTELDAFREGPVHDGPQQIAELLGQRQREALRWLGFPGTNAARNVLRRLQRPAVSVDLLLRLRGSLQDEDAARLLSHCPSVHAGVVNLVWNRVCRARVTTRLLEEVAEDPGEMIESPTAQRIEAIATLASLLDRTDFVRLRSRQEVHQLYGELDQASRRLRQARPDPSPPPSRLAPKPVAQAPARPKKRTTEFPAQPLTAPRAELGLDATPARTKRDLTTWARRQHNCCASAYYATRLRRGTLLLYRLKLGPEEATMTLAWERRRWFGCELEGPCNTPPTPAMRRAVCRWLAENRVGVPGSW